MLRSAPEISGDDYVMGFGEQDVDRKLFECGRQKVIEDW
jgi:hypothetical protein